MNRPFLKYHINISCFKGLGPRAKAAFIVLRHAVHIIQCSSHRIILDGFLFIGSSKSAYTAVLDFIEVKTKGFLQENVKCERGNDPRLSTLTEHLKFHHTF